MIFLLIVTLTSLLLAAIMSVIAWRVAGDERRRSDARIAALAAEIHDPDVGAPAGRVRNDLACASPLLAPGQPASGSRTLAILAGGGLVVGTAVALAILAPATFGRARGAAPVTAARADVPLELVALGHERDGDRLTVRGVVRNPASGGGMDRLTAEVSLFKADGGFLGSGRAPVGAPALTPGGESAFAVTLPRADGAGRYRVSFRANDRVVSHVDRRHDQS